MDVNDEQLHSIVFFLSDHVCSVIEAGDAILSLSYRPDDISEVMGSEDILNRLNDFHGFLDQIRDYEFLLVAKLNQARHWSLHLRHLDSDFRPVIDLFTTATEIVSNAEGIFGNDDDAEFNGGGEPRQLIESRQLHFEPPAEKGKPASLHADESYLLGGKIRLVDLMDVCHSFLDGLEARYGDVTEETEETAAIDAGKPVDDGQEPLNR